MAMHPDKLYGPAYFGEGRNPLSREGKSGYERYDRRSSYADVAAFLIWRNFDVRTTLDVGCAKGFVVQALRELGLEAYGTDFSPYAVSQAPAPVKQFVQVGDLLGRLPYGDGEFELVSALETLEHLPPESLPSAASELRRVCSKYLFLTIPSFGPNEHGQAGWFEGKVLDARLGHYKSLGPDYDGPVPSEDLQRDDLGQPIEGHLTIASFRWWTRLFEQAGFVRCGAVERRLATDLERYGRAGSWDSYVFLAKDAPAPIEPLRPETEVKWAQRLLGLGSFERIAQINKPGEHNLGNRFARVKRHVRGLLRRLSR